MGVVQQSKHMNNLPHNSCGHTFYFCILRTDWIKTSWFIQSLVHSAVFSYFVLSPSCLIACAAPVLELRVELEDVETAPPSVEVTLNTCCHCMASHVCGGKFYSVTNLTFTHVISQMHLIRDNSVGWRSCEQQCWKVTEVLYW